MLDVSVSSERNGSEKAVFIVGLDREEDHQEVSFLGTTAFSA